ncbi:uncharacterized protein LOC124696584 [Lolium rigidum]|uniref:uncharacterized protein LOC124696584 n=1 Tax=Lolium rigidum TaxID=89674 RepID=UPI001F5DDC62|nr:uncharacterized protein LOC124696584 [Lolium rigidum]
MTQGSWRWQCECRGRDGMEKASELGTSERRLRVWWCVWSSAVWFRVDVEAPTIVRFSAGFPHKLGHFTNKYNASSQGGCPGSLEIEGKRSRRCGKAEAKGSHPPPHDSSTSPLALLTSSTNAATPDESSRWMRRGRSQRGR